MSLPKKNKKIALQFPFFFLCTKKIMRMTVSFRNRVSLALKENSIFSIGLKITELDFETVGPG